MKKALQASLVETSQRVNGRKPDDRRDDRRLTLHARVRRRLTSPYGLATPSRPPRPPFESDGMNGKRRYKLVAGGESQEWARYRGLGPASQA